MKQQQTPKALLDAVQQVIACQQAYEQAWTQLQAFFPGAPDDQLHEFVATLGMQPVAIEKKTTRTSKRKAAAKKSRPKAKTRRAKDRATEGRRAVASGIRPPLKEAIATVMGKRTLGVGQVLAGLKRRGWMPETADERGYIVFCLSSNKRTFERVSRGHYKVREEELPPSMEDVRAYARRRGEVTVKNVQGYFKLSQPAATGMISTLVRQKELKRTSKRGQTAVWSWVR